MLHSIFGWLHVVFQISCSLTYNRLRGKRANREVREGRVGLFDFTKCDRVISLPLFFAPDFDQSVYLDQLRLLSGRYW